MSKYDFVLLAAQSDDFVEKLRELGLVDITAKGWEPSEEDRQLMLDIEGLSKALACARSFAEETERCQSEAQPYASGAEAYAAYVAAQQQATSLGSEIARLEKAADELRPWGAFDPQQMQALSAQGIAVRYFSTPASNFAKMHAEWEQQATLSLIAEVNSVAYFVAIVAPGEEITLDAQEMKTPSMDIREAERRIAQTQQELSALDTEFSRIAASEKLLAAHEAELKERLQGVRVTATATPAADGTLLVMEGWAETELSNQVDALLEAYPNVVYLKSDPTPEDDTPVKLHNGWFAHIFEMVGDMYARPKYGTIDLTPFFAPFYMLFFGICLNDAGYGAILALMGGWMLHKNPNQGTMRRAAWFATLCGLATIAFGLLCGSFFGVNLGNYFHAIPFFDFQGKFFSIALVIGLVQILFGLTINVYVRVRSFGWGYAFGPLGWLILLLTGCAAAGLPMLGIAMPAAVLYAGLGVGGVLMLLLNTPGRNPLLNLGAGLWDLYNNITGLLSDVLSYIRLFAIGLSGGVLALVFNTLAAGFVPEGANIVVRLLVMIPILLVGHGINLFMSTISSFVHPMRLTFVEFFKNAGFEMASRSFDPLRKINDNK